ncbi:Fc.00g074120.m01.CDS01 [Cosmosporella sp. VM-42]
MAPLVWFSTGCSSGFGRVFVDQILARGDLVVATARRAESLDDLRKTGAAVLQLDVNADQNTINGIVANAIAIYGHIDVLVNNAAYVVGGAWEDLSAQDIRQAFETNVFGALKVTKALLPHFRGRRYGTTVFISSISGWHGVEFNAGYSGTKFALEGMVESLWRETAPLGLQTLLIEPGFFRTELLSNTNLKTIQSNIPDYADRSKKFNEMLVSQNRNQIGDPKKAVSIILDLVRREGISEGRDIPFRLALGADSYDLMRSKCVDTLKMLDGWKAVTCSTDIGG